MSSCRRRWASRAQAHLDAHSSTHTQIRTLNFSIGRRSARNWKHFNLLPAALGVGVAESNQPGAEQQCERRVLYLTAAVRSATGKLGMQTNLDGTNQMLRSPLEGLTCAERALLCVFGWTGIRSTCRSNKPLVVVVGGCPSVASSSRARSWGQPIESAVQFGDGLARRAPLLANTRTAAAELEPICGRRSLTTTPTTRA